MNINLLVVSFSNPYERHTYTLMSYRYNEYIPVIKNFFIYSVGSVILRSITGVIALINLRIFTPAEFGTLALVNNFLGLFPIFLNLGLRQAFWIEYFHKNAAERKTLANYILLIYLTVAIPIITLCYFHTNPINRYIFLGNASQSILIFALTYCFFQFFSELYLQILRNEMKAITLVIIQLSAAFIAISTNLILVFYLRIGILGAIIANLMGLLFICACAWHDYIKQKTALFLKTKNFGRYAKYLFILGFPFIPNIIFSWILSSGDRWVLAYLTDVNHVGIYALADMVGQIFNMCILYPMSGSYTPYMLGQFQKESLHIKELEKKNRKSMWGTMAFMGILVTLGSILAFFIGPHILPSKYHPALNYIWFLLIGYVFFMGTYFSSCILIYKKRTWTILGMNIIAASLNIILNFLLIPSLKIYGCVFATLISYIVFFVLNLFASNRVLSCLPSYSNASIN